MIMLLAGPVESTTMPQQRNSRTCARWNSLCATCRVKESPARKSPYLIAGTNTSSMNSRRATRKTLWRRWWPVLTGGVGHEELREFYFQRFIPQMPPDTSMTPVSRTIGIDRVVDEMVFEFTHTIKMDWMLPGVAPTGKHVKIPLVVIVHFRDGKLAHEHIYWDQASVLAQLGLIDSAKLPVAGVETAEKVLDPSLPSNELMKR